MVEISFSGFVQLFSMIWTGLITGEWWSFNSKKIGLIRNCGVPNKPRDHWSRHDFCWTLDCFLVSKTVTPQSVDKAVVKCASPEGVIHLDKEASFLFVSVLELFE